MVKMRMNISPKAENEVLKPSRPIVSRVATKLLLFGAALGIFGTVSAQVTVDDRTAKGATAVSNVATSLATNYFGPITNLMYALGALSGMIAIYQVYNKVQKGDQEAGGKAMAWLGGCIILVVAASVLKAMFLD